MSNSADGAQLSPRPTLIECYQSGTYVDLADPDPATLHLEDIAHSLGLQCRFAGVGIRHFYSIATHSVLVHDLMEWDMYRAGALDDAQLLGALFHDTPEAYLQDLTSPLKKAMRGEYGLERSSYDQLTKRMEKAICSRFGLKIDYLDGPFLNTYDLWALQIEGEYLTKNKAANFRNSANVEIPNGGNLPRSIVWGAGRTDGAYLWLSRVSKYRPSDGKVKV